jgi:hypothetical protein
MEKRTMLKTLGLIGSLVGNAILLGALLSAESEAYTPAGARTRAPLTSAALPRDPAEHLENLRALGLDEHRARTLLGAELLAAANATVPPPADRYWLSPRQELAEHALGLAGAHAELRRELVRSLGPGAADWPELAAIFRPLDRELPFLTSEQQIALHEWRLHGQRDRLAAATDGAAPPDALSPHPGEDALAAVLPAHVALEVALRESPVAEQLRSANANLDEAAFREAYEVLAAMGRSRDLETQLEQRRRLRKLLGASAFDRMWAARDPLAAAIRRTGRQLGLDDRTIDTAYGIFNDAQERLMEVAAVGDPQSTAAIARARTVAESERDGLVRAVGEEAAERLLAARNEFLLGARRAPASE